MPNGRGETLSERVFRLETWKEETEKHMNELRPVVRSLQEANRVSKEVAEALKRQRGIRLTTSQAVIGFCIAVATLADLIIQLFHNTGHH